MDLSANEFFTQIRLDGKYIFCQNEALAKPALYLKGKLLTQGQLVKCRLILGADYALLISPKLKAPMNDLNVVI